MLIDLLWIVGAILMFISKSLSHEGVETIIWGVAMFYGLMNWAEHRLQASGKYDKVEPSTKKRRL